MTSIEVIQSFIFQMGDNMLYEKLLEPEIDVGDEPQMITGDIDDPPFVSVFKVIQ